MASITCMKTIFSSKFVLSRAQASTSSRLALLLKSAFCSTTSLTGLIHVSIFQNCLPVFGNWDRGCPSQQTVSLAVLCRKSKSKSWVTGDLEGVRSSTVLPCKASLATSGMAITLSGGATHLSSVTPVWGSLCPFFARYESLLSGL